jgi:predicted AlkP superfamily pyrophosphatase or phosphodiesterase
MPSITSVTPTICTLMGIKPPSASASKPIEEVLNEASKRIQGKHVEKALIYAPDAIGEGLRRDYTKLFEAVEKIAPIEVAMKSVLPTYTPVCFSSMFTGAPPEAHGIRKYEKPVLSCDTLFDALARAGKKPAIVAVKNSSIDLVFRNRKIDYYSEEYDPQVESRVLNILKTADYDFILAYHQEYDDLMHASTPRNPEAFEAFKRHLHSFETLATVFNERYASKNRLVAFTPDHGTHIDAATGKGAHGTDSPDDVDVTHFWGVYKGK